MDLDHAQTHTIARHEQPRQTDMRLHGGWLVLTRVAWVIVLVLTVGLYIANVPYIFADAHIVCVSAASVACSNNSRITLAQALELQHLGLSLDFYATFSIALTVLLESVYVVIGVVIFWRRSDDRIALLSSLALITFGTAFRSFNPETALPPIIYIMSFVMAFFGNCCLGFFFYAFPTGRFVPRWTSILALCWIVYWGINNVILGTILTYPGLDFLILLGLLVSVVAVQVYRYRQISTPEQRQQTKWVVYGISLALLGVISLFTFGRIATPDINIDLIAGSLLYAFLMLIPLSIGIAILRSHLWEIDILINHTLVYGLLTSCIVGLYVFVVGYLGALFHTSGNLLISLIAAGLVAVAFQPLRSLLQRSVNRLMYGLRDEPYMVLAGLGQRLQTTLEPDAAVVLANSLQNDIRTTVKDIRRLVYELRPPALDELGLVGAIRERAAQISSAHQNDAESGTAESVQVHVEAPESLPALSAAVEVAAYRIVLEALTNVTRHAQARICTVKLELTDALEVEILDDGTGLLAGYQTGVGLLSMRERAAELGGSCIIEKRNGVGTRVFARLPVTKE